MCGEPKSKLALIQKRSEIKLRQSYLLFNKVELRERVKL